MALIKTNKENFKKVVWSSVSFFSLLGYFFVIYLFLVLKCILIDIFCFYIAYTIALSLLPESHSLYYSFVSNKENKRM